MKIETKKIIIFLLLVFSSGFSFSQTKDSLVKKSIVKIDSASANKPKGFTLYNGDTVRLYTLPDVMVFGALDPTSVDNMQQYYKLLRLFH